MANEYRITIGDSIVLNTDDIISVEEVNSVSISGGELSIDEINAISIKAEYDYQTYAPSNYELMVSADNKLFCTNKTYGAKLVDVTRGTPVCFYVNNVLVSKYYFDVVEQTGADVYEIRAISGIGLLDSVIHTGGFYTVSNNKRVKDVIANIIGGTVGTAENQLIPITGGVFNCYVETSLANELVVGRLPYGIARDNLHWLMLAYGATLSKATNGDIYFSYLMASASPAEISEDKILETGKISNDQPKTQVQVQEHTYIDRGTVDESIIVYDSATEGTATHALVLFDEPLHNIEGLNGLTVEQSNCNYAIISGSGKLQGRKYTHSTKVISKGTAVTQNNISSVSDVELISPLNSQNVLDRLYEYYTNTKEVTVSFRLADEKAGRQYGFVDAFNNDRTGYIKSLEIKSSAERNAEATFIVGYTPVSEGNNYTRSVLLTGNGTWTIPDGITKYRAILIGGGNGADGGYNGSAGANGNMVNDDYGHRIHTGAAGGKGGKGSKAADGGKVFTIEDNNATSGTTITYSCGTGGAGGARNGGAGGIGSATTFGSYSSESGSKMAGGVINLFTGEVYAEKGSLDGIDGADGGDVPAQQGGWDTTEYEPHSGDSLTYEGVTYSGGSAGGYEVYGLTGMYIGGGGGGAAYGANGNNAAPPRGGNGANAVAWDITPKYGGGACGANGSGGGGGGGYYSARYEYGGGAGGSGGLASEAQSGGDGCIIIYM